MKECELCDSPARMYCESDQASLCWDCDAKVHSANFLVARHSRCLLCHACQSLTAWKASGTKLGPTVSVCEKCYSNCNRRQEKGEEEEDDDDDESQGGNDDEDEDEDQSGGDETDDDDDDPEEEEEDDDGGGGGGDCEEDGDNQVVPWSSTPPSPPVASSSSSEESCSRFCSSSGGVGENSRSLSLKRTREKLDLNYQDDLGCSTSQRTCNHAAALMAAEEEEEEEEATSYRAAAPPKKDRKIEVESTTTHHSSATLVSSLKRLEQNMISSGNADASSKAILDMFKLSKDPSAV